MKILYGSLSYFGKKLAIPLSFLVSNKLTSTFFSILKIYLAILLGQGAGTGWDLASETRAAFRVIQKMKNLAEYLTIFDVGANKGSWSNLLAQKFPSSSFFLFEPQSGCHSIIKEKKIPNMVLVPLVVSATPNQIVNIYSTSETAGLASVYQRRDSYFQSEEYHAIETKTTTIDAIIEQYDIKCVHYMKMDIEGHELEALKGASKSLEKGIIQALTFEFGSGNINSRTYFHDFWDMLFPLGYHFYRILPWGGLLPVLEYYEDLEYFRGATNYIAVLER